MACSPPQSQFLLLICFAVMIWLPTSCGFHLRDSATLPEEIDTVFIGAPREALFEDLKLFLETGDTTITSNREAADLSINILREAFDMRLLAVDPTTGKAREFELAYTVVFEAIRNSQHVFLEPQRFTLFREFVFDQDAVIGASREEDVLREEMRRDAVQQILLRLQAKLNQ